MKRKKPKFEKKAFKGLMISLNSVLMLCNNHVFIVSIMYTVYGLTYVTHT